MVVRYEPTNASSAPQFTVFYDYFRDQVNNQTLFRSGTAESIKALGYLLKAGYHMALDDTGRITALTLNRPDNAKAFSEYSKRLTDQLVAPGFLQSITAKTGTVVKLHDLYGKPATLTVTAVSDDTITVLISGGERPQPLFGRAIVNRADGWIKSMVLAIKRTGQNHELSGFTTVVMAPAGSEGDRVLDANDFPSSSSSRFHPLSELPAPSVPSNLAPVPEFTSYGYFAEGKVHLMLPLQGTVPGELKLDHIQFYNEDDEPYPIQLWADKFDYESPYQGMARISPTLNVLGWPLKLKTLRKATYLTADVSYRPTLLKKGTFNWQPGQAQHFEVGGQGIDITPTGTPHHYQLTTTNSGQHWFEYSMEGFEGRFRIIYQQLDDTLPPQTPNWLNDNAKYALYLQQKTAQVTLELALSHEPQQVSFYVNQAADQVQHRAGLKFTSLEAFSQEPQNPPVTEQGLYLIDETLTPPWPDNLAPYTNKKGQWALPYTDAMRALCHASVKGQGEELSWLGEHVDGIGLPTNHSPLVLFGELSAKGVTAELDCKGMPHWQPLPYQGASTPWLVAQDAFTGLASETVGDFQLHYRAFDAKGKALALLNAHNGAIAQSHVKLSDISANGQLKFSGNVEHLSRLTATGPAIHKSWPLPLP